MAGMTSRERMLTALDNGRPDRLPCQVHGWMGYYLERYLDGMDWWEAYAKFDMDYAIYVSPRNIFDEKALANWQVETTELGKDADGNRHWRETITTPKGTLERRLASNAITAWDMEPLIKNEADFEIWDAFSPVPVAVDLAEVRAVHDRLGDKGIIRSHPFFPGQGSPWQSLCIMAGTGTVHPLGAREARLDAPCPRGHP